MTTRFLVTVNTALFLVAAIACAFFAEPWARFVWLVVASIAGINGVWHAGASLRGGRYSPGSVTGLLVHAPLAAYAYAHFVGCGWVSPRNAITAASYGAAYWILSEGRKLLKRAQRDVRAPHLSVLR